MTTYVIDKDGKVVENRPSMTQVQAKDGCKFVTAWDKSGKTPGSPATAWGEGDKIPAESILTPQQIKEVALCNLSHIKNAAIRA